MMVCHMSKKAQMERHSFAMVFHQTIVVLSFQMNFRLVHRKSMMVQKALHNFAMVLNFRTIVGHHLVVTAVRIVVMVGHIVKMVSYRQNYFRLVVEAHNFD